MSTAVFHPRKEAAPPTSLIGGYCLFKVALIIDFQEALLAQYLSLNRNAYFSTPKWSTRG
jgi:hypothetical protein